ncbi:hypothetical protein IscW_ISCW007141 [Ixodes scapularis]|uniref:Alpha-2-macroglobulin bait region domain-containing protein n=1 Tax=Ixodes scapularis TaxID=6945 RepID=B7PSJ4_IXOSC|nr:hypothetical protein IscW_ISCW007141 [Ixodes scapularis]|eukprot:XP_002402655.1 hypothetical protein IscW_ISCW007141 [Ixodes scapularis]
MPAVVALLVVGLLSLSSAQYAGYTDNRIDSGPIHHQQPNKRVEDMLRVTQSVTYVSGGAGGGQMLNPVPTPVSGSLGIWEVVLESTPSSSDSSSVNAVRAIRLEADFYDANYGQVRASLVAYSSYSPTNHHIQVMTSTKNPKVGEYIIFHVRSNYYVECFSYIVISKGIILLSGQEKMTSSIKTFAVTLSPEMAPTSTVIIYDLAHGNEIVADSLTFPVDGISRDKFNMTLNNRKDKTGDTIEVAIYGDPGTYVALSAVDRTLYNMQAGTEISYSEIKPGKSAVVYMPIVAMRIGTINVTVLSKTQIAKDMVTRSILVEPDGIPQARHTSLLLDLTQGAYLIKYLDTNITETPILPFRQDRLYIFGSNKATLSIVGDVVGPAFPTMPVNATSLLSKPFYCGEQNMFSFAANLYTLLYLRLTNQRDVSIEKQAFKYLNLGGMRYWSRSDLPAPPVLIENNRPYLYPRLPFTNDASNVETTSYGLLVHVARQAVVQKEIVEWLNTQRLSHGAWASTQDTLMAMQALTEFSVQSRSRDVTDITVTVEAPSTPGFTRQLHIGRDNLSKLQTLSMVFYF